jgi:hypothetical protein
MTLIQFGFYSRNAQMPVMEDDSQTTMMGMGATVNETWTIGSPDDQSSDITSDEWKQMAASHWVSTREWISFLLMTVGTSQTPSYTSTFI